MKVFGTMLISVFMHRCNSISSNGMMSSAPAVCRGNKKQVLSACRAAQTFVWGGFQHSNPPPLPQRKLAPLYLKGPDIEDALRRPSAKEEQVQKLCRHFGAALGLCWAATDVGTHSTPTPCRCMLPVPALAPTELLFPRPQKQNKRKPTNQTTT